ncbi:type III secretion system needle length determinant [Vibrio antiquarius]|uniref:type III secretion system needle length determinant n=1 Tax=Vibrio antiquarius (strain Ex25) TaxID=150340 RepID=UPI00265A6825|nr:type III secretion system needle length determinant [Vibrio antiquarius]MCR9581707.1 type III secretion system needle length determinant [Vibrio antiquarius]MCR9616903.1 type III secretion system needle length determinant [Vibrio antiquarius]
MRITPTEETPNTLYKSTPEKKPLEREVELQSQFERAMTEKPSKEEESTVASKKDTQSRDESLPLRHEASQTLDKQSKLSNQEASTYRNTATLKGKSDVVTKKGVEKPQDDATNSEEHLIENSKLHEKDKKLEIDQAPNSSSIERVGPHSQAQASLDGSLPKKAVGKSLTQDAINNANFTTKQTETTHNKRATQRLQDTGKLTDKTDSRSETKSLEKVETKSALVAVKADDEKAEPQHLPSAATQGDVILKSVASQAQPAPVREVNTLLQQLVDKIYVSLPTASDNKEVRLFLSEGQLKGGEIHIKLDAQGYSVTIRQEHALSIISQQARQDLAERLNRFGGDQPLRLAISEQTQQLDQQQHEQQHSRQKRSVYEEWQAENDL